MGSTRDQVHAKYGPPDEVGDWGAAVGWDGPVSIYRGPFTSSDGTSAAGNKGEGPGLFPQVGRLERRGHGGVCQPIEPIVPSPLEPSGPTGAGIWLA